MKKSENSPQLKRIAFRLNLKGQGIVNFSDNRQRWIFNNLKEKDEKGKDIIHTMSYHHNNVSYAKKSFLNEKLDYKIMISSDCLRNAIFDRDYVAQSAVITHNKELLIAFLASPAAILRGFLLTENDKDTPKRKSAFSIVDAIQTCNAKSYLEAFSKSGEKISKKTAEDSADNSFFVKETIGEIEYKSNGIIDMENLQFVSLDQLFDRFAFNPDYFEKFKEILKLRIPEFDSNIGYFIRKGTSFQVPEKGFMFNQEVTNILIKELLSRIVNIDIERTKAFAKIDLLEIKPIYDLLDNSEEGWIKITSEEQINKLNFNVFEFYEESEKTQSEIFRKNLEDAAEIKRENKLVEKAAKAEENKEKTAKKKAEKQKVTQVEA